MYIKPPMYHTCFFVWRLDLMILRLANPFLGPLLGLALVMDIARLKIITSRAIKTTGTLKVNDEIQLSCPNISQSTK